MANFSALKLVAPESTSPATAPSTQVIRVLVLTDSREIGEMLPSLLDQEPGVQTTVSQMAFGQGLRAVAERDPHVLVVTGTLDDPAGAVAALDKAAPNVPSLVVVPEGNARIAVDCSLAGARGTLVAPYERHQLVEAIRQVHERELRRRLHASHQESTEARPHRPRVIAVHGAKGGVGTTTVACNLAASLKRATSSRVALVDADLLGGGVGVHLDLAPLRSLGNLLDSGLADSSSGRLASLQDVTNLLPELRHLDAELLGAVMTSHRSGVDVLLAPEALHHAEAVRGEDMQQILSGLRPYYDYIVVDTPSRVTPVTLAALDEADRVIFLVTPELAALRNAARFLQLSNRLGYTSDKVLLVENRANSRRDITTKVIEEHLQRAVVSTVPSDGQALVEHQNSGCLLITAKPKHAVSQAIDALGDALLCSFGSKRQTKRAVTGLSRLLPFRRRGRAAAPAKAPAPKPVKARLPALVAAAASMLKLSA